jgi:hypothetical protein
MSPELTDALYDLAAAAHFGMSANHMTCTEVDALARVLWLTGYEAEAIDLLMCHAEADDEGERHYYADEATSPQDKARWFHEYLQG